MGARKLENTSCEQTSPGLAVSVRPGLSASYDRSGAPALRFKCVYKAALVKHASANAIHVVATSEAPGSLSA